MWKLLTPYGSTCYEGHEFFYNLPQDEDRWAITMHPDPVSEPDGKECGPGGLHLMKHGNARYAPNPWWPWWAKPAGKILGEDDEKIRAQGVALRRVRASTFWRTIRLGWWSYLNYANLSNANLGHADLSNTYLGNADLGGAYLYGADLRASNLRNANLRDAYLDYANLRGSYLDGACLVGADLSNANLSNANLCYAELNNANLGHADLSDAYLDNADLRNSNLRDVNLAGADLRYANLDGVDLRYTYLDGAYLRYANWTDLTIWPEGFEPK